MRSPEINLITTKTVANSQYEVYKNPNTPNIKALSFLFSSLKNKKSGKIDNRTKKDKKPKNIFHIPHWPLYVPKKYCGTTKRELMVWFEELKKLEFLCTS